jgi:Raf kinase inhibitor-like YbhB/YbcL family protein
MKAKRWTAAALCLALLGCLPWLGCAVQRPTPAARPSVQASDGPGGGTTMKIWSPDFEEGGPIPARFTCDGEDVAPALKWSGVPSEAKSLALVVDDPDAPSGTWVHWVVVNLPPRTTGLDAGAPLPAGALEVPNDFGRPAYGGPCPPGGTHRYYFKLYALDVPALTGLTRKTFAAEIGRHARAEAQTMGTYRRRR